MTKRVSMADVARLAGVSKGTVSRVLSGSPGISQETRATVLEAVAKVDYRPNLLAQSLRSGRTHFVIAVLPDITNPFFSRIVRGMEDLAQSAGYNLLLCNTANDPTRELAYIDLLRHRRADGIVFLTARVDSQYVVELARSVPVVLACEYIEGISVAQVSIDNIEAAARATTHLIRLGHRRIGFINGSPGIVLCRDRYKGYRLAMQQAGLPEDPGLVREGDFHFASGYEAAWAMLRLADRPTAVFASNDEMAIGAIRAAREARLCVPEDLAVVGFDDIAFAAEYDPPLTTISQPVTEIGSTAMQMLLDLINGRPLQAARVILEHRLTVRASCGAVARVSGGDASAAG